MASVLVICCFILLMSSWCHVLLSTSCLCLLPPLFFPTHLGSYTLIIPVYLSLFSLTLCGSVCLSLSCLPIGFYVQSLPVSPAYVPDLFPMAFRFCLQFFYYSIFLDFTSPAFLLLELWILGFWPWILALLLARFYFLNATCLCVLSFNPFTPNVNLFIFKDLINNLSRILIKSCILKKRAKETYDQTSQDWNTKLLTVWTFCTITYNIF